MGLYEAADESGDGGVMTYEQKQSQLTFLQRIYECQSKEDCSHPMDKRWQWMGYWECCACYRRFDGVKTAYHRDEVGEHGS